MAKRGETIKVFDVVRLGDKLIVPEDITYEDAIVALDRKAREEEEVVELKQTIDVSPFDGAHALFEAAKEMFGWASARVTPSMFGPQPPQFVQVRVGPNETVPVLWGTFSVPGVDGTIQAGWTRKQNGAVIFEARASCKQKHSQRVRNLFEAATTYAREHSIYRSKAFRIRFTDEDGDQVAVPEPEFIDLASVDPSMLVFRGDLEKDIDLNLWTPLKHPDVCARVGIPRRRGFLLAGPYGTGKTLLARVTAKVASEAGWTFVYVERPSELSAALRFAAQYQPALVFAEDVDQIMASRDQQMNELTAAIDGVDNKANDIMLVLTTNHAEDIHPVMLRPGRIDVVLSVDPPDSEAVERLLRRYGGDLIGPRVNVTPAAEVLEGQIPAVIAEVIRRAKLAAVARSSGDIAKMALTAEDLRVAAVSVVRQVQALSDSSRPRPSVAEQFGAALGTGLAGGFTGSVTPAGGKNGSRPAPQVIGPEAMRRGVEAMRGLMTASEKSA